MINPRFPILNISLQLFHGVDFILLNIVTVFFNNVQYVVFCTVRFYSTQFVLKNVYVYLNQVC